MLQLTQRDDSDSAVAGQLCLPFAIRQKSRFRAQLDDGSEVGVIIERGSVLRGGDRLRADDGSVVAVKAAAEPVSRVTSTDEQNLARGAYHLGNRHVPLQVGDGWLAYLRDHVLDDMCRQLGLSVEHVEAPFEPESGAYGGGHHHHHD